MDGLQSTTLATSLLSDIALPSARFLTTIDSVIVRFHVTNNLYRHTVTEGQSCRIGLGSDRIRTEVLGHGTLMLHAVR